MSPRWIAETPADEARWRAWIHDVGLGRDVCNAALALGGAGSAYCWAFDSDVDDPARAARVEALAEEHLGPTPYRRGRHRSNRFARLYRMEGLGALAGLKGVRFRPPEGWDGKSHVDEIEVLASPGNSVTLHGRHHAGGEVLEWTDLAPGVDEGATPDLAPVVTRERVEAYLDALRAEFGEELEAPRVRAPRTLATDAKGARVLAPPPEGRVKAGRNNGVWELVVDVAWLAPNLRLPAEDLLGAAVASVDAHYDTEDWADIQQWGTLEAVVRDMLGRICPERDARVAKGARGRRVSTVAGVEVAEAPVAYDGAGYADPDIACLVTRTQTGGVPAADKHVGRSPRVLRNVRTLPDPIKAAARALQPDRAAATAEVASTVEGATGGWLRAVAGARGLLEDTSPNRLARRREASGAAQAAADDLFAWGDVEGGREAQRLARDLARQANGERAEDHAEAARAVWLLRAPTGAGKTTAMLRAVLALKAELARVGKRLGPILFMAPSYSLLDDIVQRASGMTSSTADVPDEAARVAAAADEARKLGLRTMVYKGKGQHCTHPAFATLAAAGVGTSHLCHSQERYQDPDTREWRTRDVECPLREGCGFWTQRAAVADMDIVFLPSAYLTLPIPEEVREAAVALVVDESMTSQMLASCSMPVDVLLKTRPEPTLSKRDKAAGMDAGALVEARADVCAVAREAMLSKEIADRDPANALVRWAMADRDVGAAGLRLRLDAWVNVVGRAMDVHEQVNPALTTLGAQAVAERRRLSTCLGEEHRLAKVVRERVEALLADRMHAEAGIKLPPTARGAWDHRLQVLRRDDAPPTVRIAWRRKNSFATLPTLLMDASADVDIVRKLYAGRRVVVREATCQPYLRILLVPDGSRSDTSLTPWRVKGPWESAEQVDQVRRTLDAVSVLTGASRFAVFSTKRLEVQLQTAWERPLNCDWLHYGALVGVDHMRRHAMAVVIGRQELPPAAIDALVAALTYDDPEPEAPIDRLGTGLDAQGREVRATPCHRVVAMRDGSDVEVPDRTYAGAWARRVQRQASDEGVRQAIGRLRDTYRDGPAPLVVILGQVAPEGYPVDAVAALRDVAVSPAAVLAGDVRRLGIVRIAGVGDAYAESAGWAGAPDQRMRRGEHPAQRGMAEVAWRLADGTEAAGFVPAGALADGSMPRRLALYGKLSRKGVGADPALRVLRAPEMAEVFTRPECPKMRASIGPAEDVRACESAAAEMAARVPRAADLLIRERPGQYGRHPPEADTDLRAGRVIATLLALRPRAAGEAPNDPMAPFVAHEKLPALMREALTRLLAEDAADHIEGECLEPEPEPAPAPTAANDEACREALWAEMGALLDAEFAA